VDEDANELKQVTPADIQHAAQTYLTRQRLSIAHVLVEKTHE
jgi:zinc protease